MTASNTQTERSATTLSVAPSWKIKLLYDGECPLCLREVNFLRKRDAGRGLVRFVDIADQNYSPDENSGIDFETAMGRIHAILPNGTVVKNVEVFRRVYETLGMGWVYAITKVPIVGAVADALYGVWADRRLALTGRADLATVIADRIANRQSPAACDIAGRCRVDDGEG